eukprot:jgi/Mesvir1/21291/Mv21684-RA.1
MNIFIQHHATSTAHGSRVTKGLVELLPHDRANTKVFALGTANYKTCKFIHATWGLGRPATLRQRKTAIILTTVSLASGLCSSGQPWAGKVGGAIVSNRPGFGNSSHSTAPAINSRFKHSARQIACCSSGSDIPGRDDAGGASLVTERSVWLLYAVYMGWLILSPPDTIAPGDPIWAIKPETLDELVQLSLNFFFINSGLNAAGIHTIPEVGFHPMSEALFNFVNAWGLLFSGLLFSDVRRKRAPANVELLWGCQMFLTNIFLLPYIALRLRYPPPAQVPESDPQHATAGLSGFGKAMVAGAPVVGMVGLAAGLTSLWWGCFARAGWDGEFGDLAQRLHFLISRASVDRPTLAFLVDMCLYSVLQGYLIGENVRGDAEKEQKWQWLRWVPLVGLAVYNIVEVPERAREK